jgi:hypothetical protein
MPMPYFGQNFPAPTNTGGSFLNKIMGGVADTNRMVLGHQLAKDLVSHREEVGAHFQQQVDTNREVAKAAMNTWTTRKNYAANRSHLRAVNKMTNAGQVYPEGHPQEGQPVNPNNWSGVIQAATTGGTSFQRTPTFTGRPGTSTQPDESEPTTNSESEDQPKLF